MPPFSALTPSDRVTELRLVNALNRALADLSDASSACGDYAGHPENDPQWGTLFADYQKSVAAVRQATEKLEDFWLTHGAERGGA